MTVAELQKTIPELKETDCTTADCSWCLLEYQVIDVDWSAVNKCREEQGILIRGFPFAESQIGGEVYIASSAFNDEECYTYCSDDCYHRLLEKTFACEWCNRIIQLYCGDKPQYRDNDNYDYICLCCYEKEILTNGITKEAFEKGQATGKLPGMFFSTDNDEPLKAGYTVVEEYDCYFIQDMEDSKKLCAVAIDQINLGKQVVIGYESLSITGDEGYVTMFTKDVQVKRT